MPKLETSIDERGVARVVIDNSPKLNCLTTALMQNLVAALDSLARDDRIRVTVITGAGAKAFIGGASIDEMAVLDSAGGREFISLVHACCDTVRRMPTPTIARVDGYTLGAGLEFAAACDIRIASDRSNFAMPEVRLGIPSVVEAVLLPGLIGWGRTRLLLLTGRSIDAATALTWGLIEEAVPAGDLDAAVARCVAEILACGPGAVRLQKKLILSWEQGALAERIQESIEAFSANAGTDEPRRMMAAHLEARRAKKK